MGRPVCAWCVVALGLVTGGCRSAPPVRAVLGGPTTQPVLASAQRPPELPTLAPIVLASRAEPAESKSELTVEALIAQVLARNPSLAEMTAAWQAARARYPQVTSLDDPMFGAYLGPGSFGSNNVEFAYRLEVAQKLPFPGKLNLRGQAARAQADATGRDVDDMRLMLVEAARNAFADYFLVHRALEVNAERLKRLQELRQNAAIRVKTGAAHQQEIVQADLEIARQGERQLELEQMRQVARARLNTLQHLPPDAPVPPPPSVLRRAAALSDLPALRAQALAARPDLAAAADRLVADEAALGLAQKDYYPDLEVMAAYDAFWQGSDRDLRTQVGMRVNLPVPRARRHAAFAEAQARLAARRAELERKRDTVLFEVQQAYEKARQSEQTVKLYEKSILPAAQTNVKEAIAAYTNAKIPFLTLVEAQNKVVDLRDRYFETQAEHARRLATLERVCGGFLENGQR